MPPVAVQCFSENFIPVHHWLPWTDSTHMLYSLFLTFDMVSKQFYGCTIIAYFSPVHPHSPSIWIMGVEAVLCAAI